MAAHLAWLPQRDRSPQLGHDQHVQDVLQRRAGQRSLPRLQETDQRLRVTGRACHSDVGGMGRWGHKVLLCVSSKPFHEVG